MRRTFAAAVLAGSIYGCGGDADDGATPKTAIPFDQVPAHVMKAAKEAAPDLTFYAAYKDKYEGQDSIELKGKTKTGKIKEIEVSPDGKYLGTQ
jgi:hypothetical protein